MNERISGRPCSLKVSKANLKSSAVIGTPSLKRASGRRSKITQLLSAGYSALSAMRP